MWTQPSPALSWPDVAAPEVCVREVTAPLETMLCSYLDT